MEINDMSVEEIERHLKERSIVKYEQLYIGEDGTARWFEWDLEDRVDWEQPVFKPLFNHGDMDGRFTIINHKIHNDWKVIVRVKR